MFTGYYWGEANHVYYRADRFRRGALRTRRHLQPPAKGGSTSMTAPSSSTIESLAARPTGSAFTRNDDLAMTVASRVSGCRLATAASSASRRVTASTDSSGMPAASFAAAQYLMVTLAMSVILTSTGPRAVLPPGPVCVYTDNEPSHPASVREVRPTRRGQD